MFRLGRSLSFVVLSVCSATSYAVSFDCQKASTFVEKAVCQDQTLSILDDELSSTFKNALASSKNPATLTKQQLAWLKNTRNICQTNTCLEKVYSERIAALGTVKSNNRTGVDGQYARYDEKGKPDYHSASLIVSIPAKGSVKIVGSALWVKDAKTGNVNTGETNGTFALQGDQLHYKDDGGCEFVLLFGKNALTINNDNGQCGGANVSFNGYYKKIQ